MKIRFFYNMLLALAAGFLVVATQAFIPANVVWIAFGIAVGITAVALLSASRPVGITQRVLSLTSVVLGAWTIVASLVFAPTTVVWLAFASALGFVALAIAGLTAHELTTERVVHSFEVSQNQTARNAREPIAA